MKKIELWDHQQNYYWGDVSLTGDVQIYGHNNIYIFGTLKDSKFELFDRNHDYIWGNLVNEGSIELWRRSNHAFIWGNLTS